MIGCDEIKSCYKVYHIKVLAKVKASKISYVEDEAYIYFYNGLMDVKHKALTPGNDFELKFESFNIPNPTIKFEWYNNNNFEAFPDFLKI